MSSVAGYIAMIKLAASATLANRGQFLLRALGVICWFGVALAVWGYATRQTDSAGYTWPEIKTYLLIAATVMLVGLSDVGFAERITHGRLGVELSWPLNVALVRICVGLGETLCSLGTAVVLWLASAALPGGFVHPRGVGGAMLVVASLLASVVLKTTLTQMWSLAAFWAHDVHGVTRLRDAVTNLLAGSVVPLAVMPGWYKDLAYALPFASLVQGPYGIAASSASAATLLWQVGWVAGVAIAGTIVWRRGTSRFTAFGG